MNKLRVLLCVLSFPIILCAETNKENNNLESAEEHYRQEGVRAASVLTTVGGFLIAHALFVLHSQNSETCSANHYSPAMLAVEFATGMGLVTFGLLGHHSSEKIDKLAAESQKEKEPARTRFRRLAQNSRTMRNA